MAEPGTAVPPLVPPGFLWGVASSGYQCEGGYNGEGQPRNNWASAENDGRVMRTGSATDFWNRYAEDFALCQSIGLNAFRLSIEWARVQPSTSVSPGPPPPFDSGALDHYADIVASARRHGIEPVITLHHFTHPAWLAQDPWLEAATPELFRKFVRVTVHHLIRRLRDVHSLPPVRWFVTLNEPNMLVLNTYLNRQFPAERGGGLATGVRAYNGLLSAHIRAYNTIHDLYEEEALPTPRVTMNTFCSDAYWSENMLLDLLESRDRGVPRGRISEMFMEGSRELRRSLHTARLPFPSDPFVWIGRGVHYLTDLVAPRHATSGTFEIVLDELAASPRTRVLDYLGLDYYDPFTGHIFRPPSFHDLEFPSGSPFSHLMAGLSRKWWDWHVLAEGLHFFASYYSKRFGGREVMIAENGMAQQCKPDGSICEPRKDRISRSAFLEDHVRQVARLAAEGVPIRGYLHWSITDNYEWGSYTPRFGLFSIDYTDHARRLRKNPFGDEPSQTYKDLIRKYTPQGAAAGEVTAGHLPD